MGVDFLPLGEVSSALAGAAPIQAPIQGSMVESAQPIARVLPHRDAPNQESVACPGRSHAFERPAVDPAADPIAVDELRACSEHLHDPQARLDALRSAYEAHAPHRHFHTQFTSIVFGEGDPQADLMFVGEAPGEQEDLTGRPFVGRAGQLLEKMIQAMGYSRQGVYITNVLKTRPPNNATPTTREAALCEPYLMEQIRIIEPKVIVTLGLPATELLLKVSGPMRSMRGRWHRLPAQNMPEGMPTVEVMPTYHPAYLLRSYTQENRRKVWSDLTQVIDRLGGATR